MPLADEWRDRLVSLERPQLLGFSRDDSLIYATARRVALTPEVQKILDRKDAMQPTDEEKSLVKAALRQSVRVLRSWDALSGAPKTRVDFKAPESTTFSNGRFLNTMTLSNDGRTVIAIANDYEKQKFVKSRLEKYDLQSGALIDSFAGDEKTRFSSLSDDGRRALASVAGDGKQVQLWDVEAQKLLQVLADGKNIFTNVFFVQDNTKLLLGGRAGEILIYDLQSNQIERRLSGGHWGRIDSLDMTPDGKTLMSAAYQGNAVQLWDLSAAPDNQLQAQLLSADHNVRRLALAPDGSFWIGYGTSNWQEERRAGTIYITGQSGKSFEARHLSAAGEELEKISLPETFLVDNVTFSPDFKLVAGQLSTMPQEVMVHGAGVGVWDLKTKKLLWRLSGNKFMNSALAFAPDGQTLATGRGDDVVELWEMKSGQLLRPAFKFDSAIEALSFAPDGKTLAIGTRGGTIQILDVTNGAVREELTEDFAPHDILFSPDGKYLLSGGSIVVKYETTGFKIVLRDLANKRIVREWQSDGRYFGGASFSPDGQRVAFSHYSDLGKMGRAQVEIWDIASNTRVGIVPDYAYGQLPVFSPDGETLFTVGGSWIKSWKLSDVLAQQTP